jgi:hypothetical protein
MQELLPRTLTGGLTQLLLARAEFRHLKTTQL